ncbi:hypothetical protein DFP72DRAFT_847787 [Ephemerocybe angulata]|uniref:Uncharacterized protein n=1 Tax=Ephemerocybe angulata TaxID=980116 RepID=A0A8H6M5A0_9AGAR|nr:hypothetical protein DFP72DRAFT_847787 [Tulosesus angulatus]
MKHEVQKQWRGTRIERRRTGMGSDRQSESRDIPCRTEPGMIPLHCTRKIIAPNSPLATLSATFELLDQEYGGDEKYKRSVKGRRELWRGRRRMQCIVEMVAIG